MRFRTSHTLRHDRGEVRQERLHRQLLSVTDAWCEHSLVQCASVRADHVKGQRIALRRLAGPPQLSRSRHGGLSSVHTNACAKASQDCLQQSCQAAYQQRMRGQILRSIDYLNTLLDQP